MNLFGMGAWEITVILIAALIIFGPGKLPEVAGQVGKAVRDFRRMTTDLTTEFEQNPGVQELRNEIAGIRSELTGATEEVKREVSSVAKTATSATAGKPAKSTTAHKAGASSTASKSTSTTKTTTTAAKATGTTATTGKTGTTAAKAPPKPVATKKDPLADVSFLDLSSSAAAPTNGNRQTDVNATAPSTATAATERSTDALSEPSDAIARARLRRQQAGYGRPRA
jgi:sec-independent protein translocase protein TatB